ncbi:response regulator [Pantanalinema sp. GBBB05]|uniref:response regulator n=1 Tax=Pantanalinema sp. GBBB05 TaxID=2604139 RepID=UPI001D33D915|nr:response regulator [Pantanalinema sp. GBBB05]
MQSEHQQRIMGYFIEEAKDHLNTIEQGLLNLQETLADPEMVNEVFRAAHSVKGGAAMLGLNAIQRVAHRLEDFFKILKDTPIKVDEELKSLFLRTSDALEDLLGQLQGPFGLTEDAANTTVAEVEPVFARLEQHLNKLTGGMAVANESGEARIGATVSPLVTTASNQALQQVFQAEVPSCLRDMLQLFKQSETDPATRRQLQELCQRLIRVGEQFRLSDWNYLVAMAERAIANPENAYRTLAPIIIKDIKQAQDLVLAGCASEIVPCAQLQTLAPPVPIEELPAELSGFDDDFADLLEVTDSQAEFTTSADLDFETELGLVEAPAALDLSFDAIEEIAPLDAEPTIASTELDSSFVSLAALDAELDSQHGPEVGMAELNTLADLFEGEDSELGLNWQEEEVLGDNTELLAVAATELAVDDSSDFSDLLFDDTDSTVSSSQTQDQDLNDLFDDELLEEDSSADLIELTSASAVVSTTGQDDLTDLFNLAESPEDSALERSDGESAIEFGDDLFSESMGSEVDTELTGLDPNLGLDQGELTSSNASALGDLGDLFEGLDEGDLTPSDALSDFNFDDFNPAEVSSEPEAIADLATDTQLPDLGEFTSDSDIAVPDPWSNADDLFFSEAATDSSATTPPAGDGLADLSLEQTEDLDDLLAESRSEAGAELALDEDTDLSDLFGPTDDSSLDASNNLIDLTDSAIESEADSWLTEAMADTSAEDLETALSGFEDLDLSSETLDEPLDQSLGFEDLDLSSETLDEPLDQSLGFEDLDLSSEILDEPLDQLSTEVAPDPWALGEAGDDQSLSFEPDAFTTTTSAAPELSTATPDLDAFDLSDLDLESSEIAPPALTDELSIELDNLGLDQSDGLTESVHDAEQDFDDLFGEQSVTDSAGLDADLFSETSLDHEPAAEPFSLDLGEFDQADLGIESASTQDLDDLFGEVAEVPSDAWLGTETAESPIDLADGLADFTLEPAVNTEVDALFGDISLDETTPPELELNAEDTDFSSDLFTSESSDSAITDDLFGDLALDETATSEFELDTVEADLPSDLFAVEESVAELAADHELLEFTEFEPSAAAAEPFDFSDDLLGGDLQTSNDLELELTPDLEAIAAEPAIELTEDMGFADLNLDPSAVSNIPTITVETAEPFPADLFADSEADGTALDLDLGDLSLDSSDLDNLGDLLGDISTPEPDHLELDALSTDGFTADLTDTSADLTDLFAEEVAEPTTDELGAPDDFLDQTMVGEELDPFSELNDFLSEPLSSESTDDLWTTDAPADVTDNFADLDDLLGDEPSEEITGDLNNAISMSDDDDMDGFADLDHLLEEESTASTTDSFTDLDALLNDDPAIATDEFADLDQLLGDEDAAIATDEFADLDQLLGNADPAPTDEFAELDDLLGEDGATAAPSPTANVDEFADLEALLGQDMVAPTASSISQFTSAAPVADAEFDELDNLLKDAEEKMGGPPSVKGRQRINPPPRRQTRSGHGFVEQTMRVPVKHLDNLSNLVGELVVNRNSLEGDQERLRQSLDNLLYQVQQLSDVGQRMQDLYERSLLESSLLASRQGYRIGAISHTRETAPAHNSTGMEYDPLEMDRFTGFHSLSQEMIELIVRVRESSSDIEFIVDETEQVTRMFRQVTTQLQEGLTRSRMVPFAQTADRLPRAVRDISIKVGKQAELNIEGRETLIDKMILEQLYDPMTHLVNNAITHGIESPEVRRAAGKPPAGRITIRTFHQGNQTIISVSDDGAGIDVERVKKKAIEKGLLTPNEAKGLSRLDVYDILFHPGFSTKDQADDFSGRGVGMDVVRTSLSEIRGVINTDSNPGKGTTFTIRLPLTLSISKALCCVSDRARIAFPMDGVEDMLDVPRERIQTNAEGQPCIPWRDTLLPVRPLTDLLSYNRHLSRGNVYGGNQEDDIVSIVVLRSAGNFLALQVDQVLGEQEIVIKQLEGPVPKPVGVAGATVLGDGRIMPIADVLELIDLSMGRLRKDVNTSLWGEQTGGDLLQEAPAAKSEPMVLIVDDSITVRELLSMTFNKVGYRVEQARDGQEAWEKLRSGLPCDIVFCDIEMPRMDGLELLSRIQKDPNLKQLPIAMLTSRGADRHRQMAASLGASGYFTKPYLEEALLDAAQRMLKGEVLLTSS